MPIDAQCRQCSKRYRLKDELAGKKFKCKNCGAAVTAVPNAVPAVPKPPGSETSGRRSSKAYPAEDPQRQTVNLRLREKQRLPDPNQETPGDL